MRSTVSYMLSESIKEPAMSHPDYEQQAFHHSFLLVLIRGIGSQKPKSLQSVFERIQKIQNVKVKGKKISIRKFLLFNFKYENFCFVLLILFIYKS